MATIYTLNQIAAIIINTALRHGQLKSAEFGDPADVLNRTDLKYPALLFDLYSSSLERGKERFPFRLWLLDLTLDHSNVTDAQSDALAISADIIALLKNEEVHDFVVEDSVQRTLIAPRHGGPDRHAGLYMDVTIWQPYSADRCQVPLINDGGAFTEEFTNEFD
jgi:hypothetical protein